MRPELFCLKITLCLLASAYSTPVQPGRCGSNNGANTSLAERNDDRYRLMQGIRDLCEVLIEACDGISRGIKTLTQLFISTYGGTDSHSGIWRTF